MKSTLLRNTAAVVLAASFTAPAFADQDPSVTDAPAGTAILPKPTVEEDLVYLKDIVALQTIRLDEAEELIRQQKALIEAQAKQLQALQTTVVAMEQSSPVRHASYDDEYKVQSGDTLMAIARKNNTSLSELAKANNLKAPYAIRVGQAIKIPGDEPAPVRVAAAPQQPAPQPAASTQKPAQTAAAQEKTTNVQPSAPAQQAQPSPRPTRVAQNTGGSGGQANNGLPTEVGVRPEDENERPYLALFSDVGGILTPKGSLFIEPSVDYTVTSDNRFFFQGIEIVDAVLIGAIEATDSDRRAITESVSLRYGLTNRLEIDGRIAYVSRQDREVGVAIDGTSGATPRNFGGYGFGDAEFGLHYQLNNGIKLPYTVANVRVKTPTGRGPFDVDRDLNTGVETELAVGSGFWTVEPSLSFILSSDPASLYANVGYQMNMSTSPNRDIVNTLDSRNPGVTRVRQTMATYTPGDALRTSIGVGLSLNERLSLNFGYDQSFFFKSTNDFELVTIEPTFLRDGAGQLVLVDGDPVHLRDPMSNELLYEAAVTTNPQTQSQSATVGSFLFGGSYAVNNNLRINLNGAIGATDEAPDARISVRASYKLFD